MNANIVDLCQGIADALNGAAPGTFSQDFAASFEFAPDYSSMDAKTLRVVVTDAGGDIELVSRARMGFTDTARVVVLWRVDAGSTGIDAAKMRAALLLLEEIARFLLGRGVANYSQTGTAQRGDGEKGKAHYMAGNLSDRIFAASLLLPYQTAESIRTEEGS